MMVYAPVSWSMNPSRELKKASGQFSGPCCKQRDTEEILCMLFVQLWKSRTLSHRSRPLLLSVRGPALGVAQPRKPLLHSKAIVDDHHLECLGPGDWSLLGYRNTEERPKMFQV